MSQDLRVAAVTLYRDKNMEQLLLKIHDSSQFLVIQNHRGDSSRWLRPPLRQTQALNTEAAAAYWDEQSLRISKTCNTRQYNRRGAGSLGERKSSSPPSPAPNNAGKMWTSWNYYYYCIKESKTTVEMCCREYYSLAIEKEFTLLFSRCKCPPVVVRVVLTKQWGNSGKGKARICCCSLEPLKP